MYLLHPCRTVGKNNVEICEYDQADMFTIYKENWDGTKTAAISYPFEDSAEQADQLHNAVQELRRLNNTQGE